MTACIFFVFIDFAKETVYPHSDRVKSTFIFFFWTYCELNNENPQVDLEINCTVFGRRFEIEIKFKSRLELNLANTNTLSQNLPIYYFQLSFACHLKEN